MDWRKVNDRWYNFSKFKVIYVATQVNGGYVICSETDDEDYYDLFDSGFKTRTEAEEALDAFMSKYGKSH